MSAVLHSTPIPRPTTPPRASIRCKTILPLKRTERAKGPACATLQIQSSSWCSSLRLGRARLTKQVMEWTSSVLSAWLSTWSLRVDLRRESPSRKSKCWDWQVGDSSASWVFRKRVRERLSSARERENCWSGRLKDASWDINLQKSYCCMQINMFKRERRDSIQQFNPVFNPRFLEPAAKLLHQALPYQHGNRLRPSAGQDKWNDRRMNFLQPLLFRDKKVLDVGCGEGTVTIQVSLRCQPRLVIGVDLDQRLIRQAHKNIDYFANLTGISDRTRADSLQTSKYSKQMQEIANKIESMPLCFKLRLQKQLEFPSLQEPGKQALCHHQTALVAGLKERTCFKAENYLAGESARHEYDTIICLKVTKWVHLNFGDAGLIRLFTKMVEELRPGGHLVLEAHAWCSYKKKKATCGLFKMNHRQIRLRPNRFRHYLGELGLQQVEWVEPSPGLSHGLSIFKKASE